MKLSLAILSLILIPGIVLGTSIRGEVGNPNPQQIIQSVDQLGGAFESTLARGRYAQIMALAEDHRPDLINGKELIPIPDLGVYQGRAYPLFAPGLAYYSVPAYLLGQSINAAQLAVFAFTAFATILAGITIFITAKSVGAPLWAAWFASITYTLATSAFPYAITLAQHNFTVLFMMTIILAGIHGPKRGVYYFFGWLAYALAIFMDYPNLMLLMPAVIFMLLQSIIITNRHKYTKNIKLQLAIIYTAVVFLAINMGHAYYNATQFGAPQNVGPSVYERAQTVEELQQLRTDTAIATKEAENVSTSLFHPNKIPNGLYVLLFSQGRGIIVFTPVVLFGLIGLYQLSTKPKFARYTSVFVASIIVNVVMYSSFGDPWGGWEYGPRYLIPTFGLLSVCLGISLTYWRQIWYRILILIAFTYSFAVNYIGVLTTNKLPAEVEARVLGLPYTYGYNLRLLLTGTNSSAFYNYIANNYFSSQQFILLISSLVLIAVFTALIIIPSLPRTRKANP